MRDILPAEMELRDAAVAQIVRVYRSHGFRRIETPALESLRFLTSGQGGENEKLVFKVLKRGEKLASAMTAGQGELADLGLRFDLTVPLARYFAENHARLPHPLKAIQIGPVWRAERPQKGRFRQFTQCDIDILGVASPAAEIELICATCDALTALGLRDLRVRLNDRRLLTAIAEHLGVEVSRHGAFFVAFDKLDKVGAAGVAEELRTTGHAPRAVAAFAAFLDDQRAHGQSLERLRATLEAPTARPAFTALQEIVDVVRAMAAGRFAIAFDPTLVRGMGYYTGPVFEITHAGSSGSIAGGGRYDEMVGKMSGRSAPACGFSIGFERIIPLLQSATAEREHLLGAAGLATERIALLYDEHEVPLRAAMKAAKDLREAKTVVVSLEPKRKNLSRQLDELAAHAYSHYAVLRADQPSPLVRPLPGPPPSTGDER
ncbi:MAG: histidine--tRNA ligase [Candidatus Rokubacteria bacterium]|nr:histidine--tRNA ligase [Candidatus Rokubacteria bacterium]